ncbi:AAA family ATPase [Rhodohalobacter sp. 8-1]|uniref:AAA family ATPase n=1 Tax=Rhodohalobacter sp. 8-1 TaxID=3131972 RepID=UPI0030EC3DE1
MIKSYLCKELIVVGGPNGSGKTTLAKELIADQNITYISADDIAYELAPKNPESVRVQAGKEFFSRLEETIRNEENVLIESTLSGKSLFSLIERYQHEYDYSVTIVFVYLANADVCVERVAIRVEKGGHEVPVEDIKRRFSRSLSNFWNMYRKLSDKWYLFYNSDDSFEEVARNVDQEQFVLDEKLFSNFQKIIEDHE